jgi:hypothetical protein
MSDEKKLSDDELRDIAGGTKNYNSSKSNTSFSANVGRGDGADGEDPKKGPTLEGE